MEKLSLKGTWKLRGEFMDVTWERFNEVLSREDGKFEVLIGPKRGMPVKKGFMEANVPCDIMTPLIENDIIDEPLESMNTTKCLWVGDLSWWFIRNFTITKEFLQYEELRLFIQMLDYNADIIINGNHIKNHKNTFRAFNEDIKRFVKVGENQIIIRLTSGYENHFPNDSISYYCESKFAISDQRVYLRKPQFTHGWDWCQPVPTCGIGQDIYIEGVSGAKITAFRADTIEVNEDNNISKLNMFFEIDNLSMCSADDTILEYEILYDNKVIFADKKDLYIVGGLNFIEDSIIIENPKLWWPNGYGEQNLYTVKAHVICRGHINEMEPQLIGIRTITIDHSKRDDGTRNFNFVVNGVKVYCKGGNWVPTDSIYLRTPYSTYETLILEAKESNFTMLRMWGGGLYEPDFFYDLCSKHGIMIMHDFMYACGYYPDNIDWFVYEASLEAEYQTKRLAHFPCMAVWTGNNEVHESYTDWFRDERSADRYYGTKIFNYVQPSIVKKNAPCIPYAPSSPYFGDRANSLESGDSHVWMWFGNFEETKFKYNFELEALDRVSEKVRMSSEFGFHGPVRKSSVEKYCNKKSPDFDDISWLHHGERHDKHDTIIEGIETNITDTSNLTLDDYLLYGGILQGVLYEEMALSLRRNEQTSGNLIWMYNDCWPETGWTTIDYYLTRKISFYFLKRGFQTKKFIIRVIKGLVNIVAINESDKTIKQNIEYGFMDFDKNKFEIVNKEIILKPHSYNKIDIYKSTRDTKDGFYYIYSLDNIEFEPATSVRGYFRDMIWPEAKIKIKNVEQAANNMSITICSDNYIPMVEVCTSNDKIKYSDNYFQLVPNIDKNIVIYDNKEKPIINVIEFQSKS